MTVWSWIGVGIVAAVVVVAGFAWVASRTIDKMMGEP